LNTTFQVWNPVILGNLKVSLAGSRSAEFGCNQAYDGVCTAGAAKRVEQGFWCTKSAKSAPSLQSPSLHLAHLMHTFQV
jgi:hypothetical protein